MTDTMFNLETQAKIDPFVRMRLVAEGRTTVDASAPSVTPWSECIICSQPGPDDFPGWPDEADEPSDEAG